jgi:hypothetical protein
MHTRTATKIMIRTTAPTATGIIIDTENRNKNLSKDDVVAVKAQHV